MTTHAPVRTSPEPRFDQQRMAEMTPTTRAAARRAAWQEWEWTNPWCDACDEHHLPDAHRPWRPGYIYVASSWRNPMQPAVIATLRAAGLDCYDFRNPEGGTGFSWKQVKTGSEPGVPGKGSDWESVEDYLAMVHHPIADRGFAADFDAMQRADTFVLVLPCGKSAHLELGWAVGAGKRTAILLEDPCEPELMYRMVDHLAPNLHDLLGWLGVQD
jgi:hypothetical protein